MLHDPAAVAAGAVATSPAVARPTAASRDGRRIEFSPIRKDAWVAGTTPAHLLRCPGGVSAIAHRSLQRAWATPTPRGFLTRVRHAAQSMPRLSVVPGSGA